MNIDGYQYEGDFKGHVMVPRRVAPRHFVGLVLSPLQFEKEPEMAKQIHVQTELNGSGARLPIYDSDGNLLWPVALSHAGIKEHLKTT